jgi:hypothetical protein
VRKFRVGDREIAKEEWQQVFGRAQKFFLVYWLNKWNLEGFLYFYEEFGLR